MNKMTTLYIVRHGRTEWNEKHIIQGHSDSPLTDDGKLQVEKLSEKLKDIKFDYIFSSDLGRALQTAEIINKERKLAIKATELLRERNYGDLEGTPSSNFKEWDELIQEMSDEEHYKFKYKGTNESDEEINTRFITFIREMAIVDPGKTVLVVSHGGFMRAIIVKLGLANYNQLQHGAVTNSGYVKIETDGVDFFIKEYEGINFTNA